MATIRKIQRKTGVVYKAIITKRGQALKSQTFTLKRDAIAWAKRLEADQEMMEALGTCGAAMRLDELVDEYILQWNGKSDTQLPIARYWVECFGSDKLADITADRIRQQLKIVETGRCRRGHGRGDTKGKTATISRTRAPKTVNLYRTVLSAVFKYAIGEGYTTVNPVLRVPPRKVKNMRTRWLDEKERERLLDACKKSDWDRLHLAVLMSMTTGMRKSELLWLRWSDIDFTKNLAYLADTKNGESRFNPIPSFVMDELRPLRQIGSGLIFASKIKPEVPFDFKKHWIKAMQAAGIENFRWHDLRHTAASLLVMNGATLYEAGQVLGHKSIQTTQRYAHISTDHKSKLVERVMTQAVKS
jgi:integrase